MIALTVHVLIIFLPFVHIEFPTFERHTPRAIVLKLEAVPRAPAAAKSKPAMQMPQAAAQAAAQPQAPSIPTAEEILQDPEKAQAFEQYFRSVKLRIEHTAETHGTFSEGQEGLIRLHFVLNQDGKLVALKAYPAQEMRRDSELIPRALRILRDSEPFQQFPQEIRFPLISFHVTLSFGDTTPPS